MIKDAHNKTAYTGTKYFTQHNVQTANATGFGAAADDYMERGIDLNEQLIMNKAATYFFRMNSDAMESASIFSGDVLVVDRSIKAVNGKIIVASVNGELLVRRYQQSFNKAILSADNKKFSDIVIDEFTQYATWGVVTCVIHLLDASIVAFNKKK
jgi:DNA polymerase V